MEVKVDLAINDSAYTFDQACGLVLGLSRVNYLLKRRPRSDGERALIDRLVARVEFGDDEVACGAERQHPCVVGVVVRTEPRETGQQSVM